VNGTDRGVEAILARHCAPVLFGEKPAALLGNQAVPKKYRRKDLHDYGIRVARLVSVDRPLLFLWYRPDLLERTLAQGCVREALDAFGYPKTQRTDWQLLLRTLQERFLQSEEFPHEVGLFLGYPVEDVLGFIACKGKDCKLCGLWKVYGDVEKAKRQFAKFRRLKLVLSDFVESGGSIGTTNLSELAGCEVDRLAG
jgi:hypothetical protein